MAKRTSPAKLALSIVAAILGIGPAAAATFAVSIPSEPISQALVDLALQGRLSISETGVDFRGARANPVAGTYTAQEALAALLAGTGFTFTFVDNTTVQIRSAASPGPPAKAAALNPEIVVVTATKRKEVAAELPYSLTVVSARVLADARAESANELTTDVAQLTATNLGAGQDKIFLRGLTDSIVPGLSESVVGLYLDDVRIGDEAPDPDLQLVDINRIEILNGPQGTLYGSGSLGGLVRIITNEPEMDEFQTAASASVAQTKYGRGSDEANLVVNIPFSDLDMAARIVTYARRDAGYIDETRLGIPNANWTLTDGVRAALKWQPDNNWSATAAVAYQHIDSGDAQYLDEGSAPFKRDNYALEPHTHMFLDGSVTVDGDLGFANVLSATAVVDRHLQEQFDASLTWPVLTGFPVGAAPFDDERRIVSFTHESRMTSARTRRLKWLLGVFVSHRDEDFFSRLAGPDASGARIVARSEAREDSANEAALFGELTYALTDQLSLTGGLRVFNASRDVKASIASILGDAGSFRGSNDQTGVTPKLVLGYTPWPALLLYAQITEGYRLGGLNADGPPGSIPEDDNAFDSDSLWNYELGTKAHMFGGLVVANGAAYFDRWNNVQTDQIGRNGSFFILNAGTVEDLGAEADVTVGPLYNLTLRGNFFWNNTQFLNANPLLVQSEGVLPGAPSTKFGISARYDLPLWGTDAFLAADYGFIGKSHLGFDETAPTMGGYHVANLRAGVAIGQWEALLFVNNLQREDQNTFGFGNPFDPNPQITPPRPRTIGLSLSWHSR